MAPTKLRTVPATRPIMAIRRSAFLCLFMPRSYLSGQSSDRVYPQGRVAARGPEPDQVFAISRSAGDGRRDDAGYRHPEIPGRPEDVSHRVLAKAAIANNTFADAAPTHLELRLDQQYEVRG